MTPRIEKYQALGEPWTGTIRFYLKPELTTDGIPKKDSQPCRKAVPAAEAEASGRGMQ